MRRTSLKTTALAVAAVAALAVVPARPWSAFAQAPASAGPAPAPASGVRFAQLSETDAQEWLSYLASDLLQGRQVFTEGYGLAAAYIAGHLKAWGLKPLGDEGTYFQTVKRHGYRVTRNSSVTVTVKGQTRTFRHGDHVTFPIQSGGNQTLRFTNVEFAGYGAVALGGATPHNDFAGRDVKGKLVVWLPGTPASLSGAGRGGRGLGGNRANYIVQTLGAAAVLGFAPAPAAASPADEALAQAQSALTEAQQAVTTAQNQVRGAGRGARRGGAGGGRGGRAAQGGADFSTVLKVDNLTPPQITADEEFHRFLLSAAPVQFDDLMARAAKGEPLTPFTLDNVSVSIQVDNTYDVVSTELTKNVVGLVEGTDPTLRSTYVMFGAHLDHVGYQQSPGGRSGAPAGGGAPDLIFNGADDDGSGSTALLGIAKAFATGPRPRRSVVFVWHAGEEAGLLGSRYFADFPPVPLDHVQAQFNIDMIGRNRDNEAGQANTVFVIGADRISTDLHNLVVASNEALPQPLRLDFEYNDPADPNSFYTRSDHYSYAVKGIPVAFFFTGTHPDYHGAGDHVDKILFPKLVRIAQMIYQTGFAVANTDRVLERDNRGPRAGRGFSGPLAK